MVRVANPSPSQRRALIKAGKWDPADPVAKMVKPPAPPAPPPPKNRRGD